MKTFTTPGDLLISQTLVLAQRIVERMAEKNCTRDEYAQLAPYIQQEFERRREERES